jgi:acyl carrier protein
MELREEIRQYVAENFVPAAQRQSLDDTTPLISGGLIDSIGMIKLMSFLERRFAVEFLPREVDAHTFDTVTSIERVIHKKLGS